MKQRITWGKTRFSFQFAVIVFVWLSGIVVADEPPTVTSLSVENPTHVLFVGNSYFYYNNSMHDHLRRMVINAGLQEIDDIKFKSVTINGARLANHDVVGYLQPGKLGMDKPFDVVVLQGHSTAALSEENRGLFESNVIEYSDYIKKNGGEVVLYMTPAYVYPHERQYDEMTTDVKNMYVSVGNSVGALVIPVGLAFEEAYRRRPDIKLHQAYDGSHPSLLGTYLAAATALMSLYNQSPVGNSYDYFGEISQEQIQFLQEVAKYTVDRFYRRN